MALDSKKVALIQVAKAQLGLTDDDYRTALKRYGGVDSSKDLNLDGFMAVMTYFEHCGFKSTSKKKNFGDRPGMASERQVALIRKLWSEFTDDAGTDATIGKWLSRTFKVSALRFLPGDKASKVITALKAMVAKKATTVASSEPAAPIAV